MLLSFGKKVAPWLSWVFVFQRNVSKNTGDLNAKMMVDVQLGKSLAALSYQFQLLNLKGIGPEEHNSPRFMWLISLFLNSIVTSKNIWQKQIPYFFFESFFFSEIGI